MGRKRQRRRCVLLWPLAFRLLPFFTSIKKHEPWEVLGEERLLRLVLDRLGGGLLKSRVAWGVFAMPSYWAELVVGRCASFGPYWIICIVSE